MPLEGSPLQPQSLLKSDDIDAVAGFDSGDSLYATRYLDDPDMRMAEAPRFREAAGLNFLVVALARETYVTIILDTY